MSPEREPGGRGELLRQLAVVLAALVLGTLVAEAAGAANLGVALTFGVVAFLLALMVVLLRRP